MSNERCFYSKILIFGEYSVIQNSMALTIPYNLFEGKLCFEKESNTPLGGKSKNNQNLALFSSYLEKYFLDNFEHSKINKEYEVNFDFTSLNFDISQGLTFNSTIPQGFGVGSSGALCAAVFDRYGESSLKDIKDFDLTETNLRKLKKILAKMESYFHGESSGLDPLLSYLNRPLLITKDKINTVQLPEFKKKKGALFILNTNRPRKTGPLVNLFLEKCKNNDFLTLCQKELLEITNNCIDAFLNAQDNELYNHMKVLSSFQLEHFSPMIPPEFKDLWAKGISNDLYALKLCGAGGGGFLLGMTKDFEKTCEHLKPYKLRSVMYL